MFTGYFSLGGNEVGNNARAIGYARTSDCPIMWHRGETCDNLAEALHDNVYEYQFIDQAPWYDPDDPDVTGRFLGLYVVSISGLSDSTRAATVTEKNTDGAQVSGYRHTSREVRVRAFLTARGMDALEAGMTWLRNALEPNACGMHGNVDCGASDMGFFVDCPPGRALVPTYSAYAEVRRNLFSDPRGVSTSSAYWGSAALGAYSLNTTMPGPITTALRWTRSGTGVGAIRSVVGTTMPTAGATVHARATIRPSTAITVDVYARPDVASATNQVALGTGIAIAAGQVYDLEVTGPSMTAAATSTSGIVFLINGGAVGQTVDISQVVIEPNNGFGFFDGAFPDDSLTDYAWLGTAGSSPSTMSVRSVADLPEGDSTYDPKVDTYRRFLHTVTCISGPLIQEERVSEDKKHYGYLVEFTLLAATPAVYGVTKEVALSPTTPSLLQDTVFNLVRTPSVGLSDGTTIGAQNFAKNPSAEVNATDFENAVEVVSGSAATSYFTAGRVVSELNAAPGTASYRGRILGNGSTAVNGRSYIWLRQQVPLTSLPVPMIAPPNGSRLSFAVWAAATIQAGASASAINGIQVTAVWRTGTTVLSTITVGSTTTAADYNGKSYMLDSQLKPDAADNVLIQVRVDVTWASSATPANNSDIRAYMDTVAVTMP